MAVRFEWLDPSIKKTEWSKEEDDLLNKNPDLLKKWKGGPATERRKKYLHFKAKWTS